MSIERTSHEWFDLEMQKEEDPSKKLQIAYRILRNVKQGKGLTSFENYLFTPDKNLLNYIEAEIEYLEKVQHSGKVQPEDENTEKTQTDSRMNFSSVKTEKVEQLRDVDKWLTLNRDAARLIERLEEMGLAEPIEIGYNILLQPGTFAQMLYDVGFRNWKQLDQYFTIEGRARSAGSLRSAANKPDSREYEKLKSQIR